MSNQLKFPIIKKEYQKENYHNTKRSIIIISKEVLSWYENENHHNIIRWTIITFKAYYHNIKRGAIIISKEVLSYCQKEYHNNMKRSTILVSDREIGRFLSYIGGEISKGRNYCCKTPVGIVNSPLWRLAILHYFLFGIWNIFIHYFPFTKMFLKICDNAISIYEEVITIKWAFLR